MRFWSALLLGTLCCVAAGCGGSPSKPSAISTAVTLLDDSSVTLVAGQTCNTGSATRHFNGTAGKPVVISAIGTSALRLLVVLYSPNYSMQVATGASLSLGVAIVNASITETGQYHVDVCEVNGLTGTVRLTVTQD